jgi:hypothetical protein
MLRLLQLVPLIAGAAMSVPLSSGDERLTRREERIARDKRREQVRSALRSAEGYWFFENMMTDEAGAIDFLGAGPAGLFVIVVRDEKGEVTAAPPDNLYLDGMPFADDPRLQACELVEDVLKKLEAHGRTDDLYSVVCFPRGELFYVGDDRRVLHGVCNVWGLSDMIAEAAPELSPPEVAELARFVQEAYGRLPIITPEDNQL